MSRGLGRIERTILGQATADGAVDHHGSKGAVLLNSGVLVGDLFEPRDGRWNADWQPTPAERKATTRGMRSIVRKYPQYALAGGKGRMTLYLFEPDDPVSAMWAKATVEKRLGQQFVSRTEA